MVGCGHSPPGGVEWNGTSQRRAFVWELRVIPEFRVGLVRSRLKLWMVYPTQSGERWAIRTSSLVVSGVLIHVLWHRRCDQCCNSRRTGTAGCFGLKGTAGNCTTELGRQKRRQVRNHRVLGRENQDYKCSPKRRSVPSSKR